MPTYTTLQRVFGSYVTDGAYIQANWGGDLQVPYKYKNMFENQLAINDLNTLIRDNCN